MIIIKEYSLIFNLVTRVFCFPVYTEDPGDEVVWLFDNLEPEPAILQWKAPDSFH